MNDPILYIAPAHDLEVELEPELNGSWIASHARDSSQVGIRLFECTASEFRVAFVARSDGLLADLRRHPYADTDGVIGPQIRQRNRIS